MAGAPMGKFRKFEGGGEKKETKPMGVMGTQTF